MSKNDFNPDTFKKPFELHFFTKYKRQSGLVLVPYTGIIKDTFKQLSRWHVLCASDSYLKQDILFIARSDDWEVVKPFCKRRKQVKALGLSAEKGLSKELDVAKLIDPFIYSKKKKPLPVKVVLRNGVVIQCKLLSQDKYRILARVKRTESEKALILIYKHGIYSVEPDEIRPLENRIG